MILTDTTTGATGAGTAFAGTGTTPDESALSRGAASARAQDVPCFHCGTRVGGSGLTQHDKAFCCRGCLTVFELLSENGMTDFYRLGPTAGVRVEAARPGGEFRYLDEPAAREKLVDFSNERLTRVTLRLPTIHCAACVWLLENLFRLKDGIGSSRVNFPRKEAAVTFETGKVKLSELATLLTSLGYEPEFKLSDLDNRPQKSANRRLTVQLGIAGFAFGNIMLLSISMYLGLDQFTGGAMSRLFGYLSLGLAVPVLIWSAADYWRAARIGLQQQRLTIEVPIALGLIALALQSGAEVIGGHGVGYFDSLTGLVFFLLCGRLFQQKTYERLVFDRDYKAFFPLAVTRKNGAGEERVSLAQLGEGDRVVIRNGELIPADARLAGGPALIDYSFVTGESEPVAKQPGDYLYAGGRQIGGAVELELEKEVSHSYLTSLWNQDAFRKTKGSALDTLTNRYSQRFTKMVIGVALGAGLFWSFRDPTIALKAFTSVLIVACPCALALAAPFVLGTAQRVLARRKIFLKNSQVLETLAEVDTVVFDKTGTLTAAGAGELAFHGTALSPAEADRVRALAAHSNHPHAARIARNPTANGTRPEVRSFREITGCGVEGNVGGEEIWLGSAAWLAGRGIVVPPPPAQAGAVVHLAVNGKARGCYLLAQEVRDGASDLMKSLSSDYETAMLSGDNDKQRARFAGWFKRPESLQFNQSPADKLGYIQRLQADGRKVLMAGDGLNDAGALQQSDVGVAIVENVGAFSPASDVIMAANMVPRTDALLRFARAATRITRASFIISALYNVVGVAIAARGWLSPVVCAILMPLSSVTVVAFACGATSWAGARAGFETNQPESQKTSP